MRFSSCFISLIGVFLAAFPGCTNSTSPPDKKDPRTYSWEVDTVYYPRGLQTVLRDIWGTSSLNVYAVGSSDGAEGKMYHYNGLTWSRVLIHKSEGGTISGLSELGALVGLSATSIFAVGSKFSTGFNQVGLIARYDGSTWREEQIDSVGPLQSIWGSSPDDLWAGGIHTLLRRQGSQWRKVDFPARTNEVQFIRITGSSSSDVYLLGGSNGQYNPYLYDERADLYHYDGHSLSIVDSFFVGLGQPAPHFGKSLKSIDGKLYSAWLGVFARSGSSWTRLLTTPQNATRIAATSASNIFVVGTGGMILHYNGIDAHTYPVLMTNVSYSAAWAYEGGVMVVGNDGYKSYIMRGR